MKKLDKKQIPQFVALCLLTVGVFGWFTVRMITPSPAAAGSLPQSVAATKAAPVVVAGAKPTDGKADVKTAVSPAAPADAPDPAAPPPTPTMRDPFVIGYTDAPPAHAPPAAPPAPALPAAPTKAGKPERVAMLPSLSPAFVGAPPAPALPSEGFSAHAGGQTAAALPPAPPAPPNWEVTGVLQSDSEKVAILRDGAARRIVRAGDFVDSVYKVVSVTRTSVTLRHGALVYRLGLGGLKAAPASVRTASASTLPARTLGPVPFASLAAGDLAPSSPGLLPAGTLAPDFQLMDTGGVPIRLSSLRGRPVLIDFWATWCGPCQQAMPHVQRLHEEFGGSIAVLSVNTWDESDAMREFVGAHPQYTTTMLYDGKADNVSTGRYLVKGIPTVYLIDKAGRVAGAYVCPTEATLRAALLALGARPAPAPALSRAHARTAPPTQVALRFLNDLP